MNGAELRRDQILAAAIRVFARSGYARARVADVAREAGVGYGLVYHYFRSKEALLDGIFADRWGVLVERIRAIARRPAPVRNQLEEVAAFVFQSYRREPELMKVLIVEVTRAAGTVGRRHLPQVGAAYRELAAIVASGQERGELFPEPDAPFVATCFFGVMEQVVSGWIFGLLPAWDGDHQRAARWVTGLLCEGVARPAQPRYGRGGA